MILTMRYVRSAAVIGCLTLAGLLAPTQVDADAASASIGSHIVAAAHAIIKKMTHTVYTHETHVDISAGVFDVDCSAFVDLLLKEVAPKHLAALTTMKGHRHLLAEDYEANFSASKPPEGWKRITRVADAQPGDILCWKSSTHEEGDKTDTGHVMVIEVAPTLLPATNARQNPKGTGAPIYAVHVIDSTVSPHGNDTRTTGQSGIGRGTIFVEVDASGALSAFHWRSALGAPRVEPMAIGRAIGRE
jgi:hypothetical protein